MRRTRGMSRAADLPNLEPVAELTADEPVADDRASYEHQCFVGGRVLFFACFQFPELVQPGQTTFHEPACFAKAAAMSRSSFSQDGRYPFFLSSLRCGSES